MNTILLYYPNFERGGVKLNFLSFLRETKKLKNKKIIISNSKDILKNLDKNFKFYNIKWKIDFLSKSKILNSFLSLLVIIQVLIKKKNIVTISFQSSFFVTLISFFLMKKIIIRVSEDPFGATKFSENKIKAIFIFLTKFITYNLSSKILTNSKLMKRNISKMIFNKKKIILFYNQNISKNDNYKIVKKKKFTFLHIGRLCSQKNQVLLIKAFSILLKKKPNHNMLIVGDGKDRKKLINLTKSLKLNNKIKFISWKKNLKKYYQQSRIFVLPSLYEGLPNVLIDALKFNLVAICRDVSGVRDIYNKSGIYFKNNNANTLSNKMLMSITEYNYFKNLVKNEKNNLNKFLNFDLKFKLINLIEH